MPKVLLSFDKFRGSLSASQACENASEAILELHPDWETELCPLTDGGEGFCEVLTQALEGDLLELPARDPLGRSVRAGLGLVSWNSLPEPVKAMLGLEPAQLGANPRIAVVEMAQASGLALLSNAERDPFLTCTVGTGDLLRCAAREGVCAILLGIGGSGTNDLGLGALWSLGLRAEGLSERTLPTPRTWTRITALHSDALLPLPPLFIACDVEHPLLGEHGATASFGPQKGLNSADIATLDAEMGRLAGLLSQACGRPSEEAQLPGSGAAGGIAHGLRCGYGAKLIPGAELVSAWLELPRRIAQADLVLTGEGCFDANSLKGKGPGAVIRLAGDQGKPVCVYAGALEPGLPSNAEVHSSLSLHAISPEDLPRDAAMRMAGRLLQEKISSTLPELT